MPGRYGIIAGQALARLAAVDVLGPDGHCRAGSVVLRGAGVQRALTWQAAAGRLADDRVEMSGRPGRSSVVRAAGGIAAVVAAMICCAGPALIGAGALGVIGAALRNPVIVVGGGLLFLGALGTVLVRRQRGVNGKGRRP